MDHLFRVLFILSLTSIFQAVPIVLKESSPSGEAVIAISSNDPEIEKYLRFGFPNAAEINQNPVISESSEDGHKESVVVESVTSAGPLVAESGRGFVSNSAFNPFLIPFFFAPLNFEGIGLGNSDSLNWLKGVEGFYDHGFPKNGEIKTVAAINDNGHIYGNIKTLTFDNKGSH